MGRAIYYCVQCSKRVSDTDLETGKGFRVGDRILCKACAPESAKATPSSKKIPATGVRSRSSGTGVGMKPVSAPLAEAPVAAPPADRKKLLLIAGGAAATLLLVVVLVFVLRKGPPPSIAVAETPTADDSRLPPPPPPPPVDPKDAAAKAELEKAREFSKKNPGYLAGRFKEYNELVWKYEGTDVARDAAKEAAAVKALILEQVGVWMAELEAEIKPLVEARDYFAASKRVEEIKPRHDLPDWRLAAEKRASELYGLGRKAAEEKPPLPPEEKGRPAAKLLSEDAKSYQVVWESAAAKATARDFAGARSELERAKTSIKDADVRGELDADLALFARIAGVVAESTAALQKLPRGGGVALSYREGGAVKRAGGAILQTDAQRVEIRSGKGSVFVDWSDVTSSTLAEMAQRGKSDPAVLAALCLLEGDVEAARKCNAELAPKWWTYAEGAAAKLPKPDPAERSARELYVTAEKNYRTMETRGAAIDAYKSLRNDFGSTSLVKLYAEKIFRRSDAGKEYFYAPADFVVEGTLQLSKSGKLESTKDSDDRDTLLNFAELEFAALAGQTYRCWVQVGACCEETFLFYYQGSEMTDTDPKTKRKIGCEPGANFAIAIKHSIRNLKKTHDEHKVKGAKVHPKTAARWEWVEIPLPKYAAPGGKKVRLMTNQAGFSIGGAVVSATRKAAPVEAEIKELERGRSADEAPLPIDPDLVGWWTFDEGGGERVIDLSGKGHTGTLAGNAAWSEGKTGGGVQVAEASKGRVEVADAEDLRIVGNLTLSIWLKQTAPSADWVCVLGKGSGEERTFGLWVEPKTKRYMFQQYGGGNASNFSGYGQKLVEPGQWTHLAVTVEDNLIRFYHNGAADGQERRPGPPVAGPTPLGIGYAINHNGMTGVFDDVRVYRRALSADEIRALYEAGK